MSLLWDGQVRTLTWPQSKWTCLLMTLRGKYYGSHLTDEEIGPCEGHVPCKPCRDRVTHSALSGHASPPRYQPSVSPLATSLASWATLAWLLLVNSATSGRQASLPLVYSEDSNSSLS